MVQPVSPLVWSPPPTVLDPVSVAAFVNQGLSSRDDAVCHLRNVAVWMARITIMRSDILVHIPMCIHSAVAQEVERAPPCCMGKILNPELFCQCMNGERDCSVKALRRLLPTNTMYLCTDVLCVGCCYQRREGPDIIVKEKLQIMPS